MADERVLVDVGVLNTLRSLVEASPSLMGPRKHEEMLAAINEALDTANEPEKHGLPTDEQFVLAAQEIVAEIDAGLTAGTLEVPDAPMLEVTDRNKGARVQLWLTVTAQQARKAAE